jgi:molybdopterin-containing oxidoreductase family membrane subunit
LQLRTRLEVTGVETSGSSPEGIYDQLHLLYQDYSRIAIASAIRLLKLRDYIPLARIAELVTIFSLLMAGFSLLFDMGRPDRIFNLILYYPQRLASSPLVWDITAVAAYLVFSVTYLYLEMREDLARLAKSHPRLRWLYRRLLPAYEPGERERIVKIVWWASVFNFPIMVMVHTTVAWIFGLMVGRPGWYGAIMGPYYVLGAVLSGVASIAIMAAIYRRLFGWQEHIKTRVFRGLGKFLSWISILYIYFMLSEFITVKYGQRRAQGFHGIVKAVCWLCGAGRGVAYSIHCILP